MLFMEGLSILWPLHALNVQQKMCAKLRDTIDDLLLKGKMKRAEEHMTKFRKDIKLMKDKMRLIDDMLEFGVEQWFWPWDA